MAAVEVTGYKDYSTAMTLWNEDEKWLKATYDFSVAGGTSAATTYSFMKIPATYAIVDAYFHVTTAFTSDGSATFEVGRASGTAVIIAQTAVASLTADAVINLVAKQIIGSNNTIYGTIGTADMTAGVGELWVKVKKAN